MTRGRVETPGGGGAISPDGPDITADAAAIAAMTNGHRVHLEPLRGMRGGRFGRGGWGAGVGSAWRMARLPVEVGCVAPPKPLLDTGGSAVQFNLLS